MTMNKKMTLLNDEFYDYFQYFNQNAGKNKTYKYLEYSAWKKIKNALDWAEEWDIQFDPFDNSVLLLSCFGQSEQRDFTFDVNDESFGYYLDKIYQREQQIAEYYTYEQTTTNNEKENKNMFNFDFGPVKSNKIRMSPFGLAVMAEDGVWKAYNSKEGKIVDVNVFTFDASKFLYKMPVAIKDIKAGDIVIHNGDVMIVSANEENSSSVAVIDVHKGEAKNIMPTYSPFGFDFITKVVSFIDMAGNASADAPFGNMLPFLMMNDDKDIDPMMFLFMNQNGGAGVDFKSNPMMLYFLAKSSGGKDNMLPLMFLMNNK